MTESVSGRREKLNYKIIKEQKHLTGNNDILIIRPITTVALSDINVTIHIYTTTPT